MKIIGLDVGTVRIGVARADSKVKIAVPAGVVPVDGNEFEQIARLGRVYDSKLFVLGLPRNNEGLETKQSEYVRQFAETLKAKIPGAKVYFQDETLTSVTAEERLKNNGKSPKAKRLSGDIDTEAAVIILQDFVEHFTEKTGGKLPKEAKKQTSKAIKKQEKRVKHRGRRIALIIAGIILLLAATAGGAVFYYFNQLGPTGDPSACHSSTSSDSTAPIAGICYCDAETPFTIPEGASTAEIAEILAENRLIKNPFIFQIFTKLNGYDGQYKSGSYSVKNCQSAEVYSETLLKGANTANVFRFTILPGETIASIKSKLEQLGYTQSEIDAAFAKDYDHPVLAGKPESQGLEGYLYGETYEFYTGESVENIIKRAMNELYKVIQGEGLEAAYAKQGLTLFQGITLASIVQREARQADMPTVAQVFLTRLDKGMALGSDVTTKYSIDLVDPERKTYTNNAAALKIEECHNTRLYGGLPCGPISNPGRTALTAVAHPTDTSYLYFLTGDDGLMYYSNTEKGHQQNIRDHCQKLCSAAL